MLATLILLPLVAAILVALIPGNYRFACRVVALLTTLATMAVGIGLFLAFDHAKPGFQFEVNVPWVQSLGLNFHVGLDGLNVGLILMGSIVAFAAACAAWEIQTYEKEFYVLLLVMTGGILGAFASLDLFFFYSFHELALIPTFIMIGIWGRGEKTYAAYQVTLYLSAGALIALVGLIALYLQLPAGSRTFDIPTLVDFFKAQPMNAAAQSWIFPLLMFGFGILVALWPFHTWAPLGYAAAPTPTAMLHAGVLKKFGLYGLIRVALPAMPEGAKSWLTILAVLCLGNILYSGWVAMRQRDLNLLIGNSSVAHMGFVFLGIATVSLVGITGAALVMVAHGLLAALSFSLTGYIYRQTGTLDMGRLGGLLKPMPFIGGALVMAAFAGCGLPGFANFPGELLVMFGAWKSLPCAGYATLAAWGALVIAALYMLRAVRSAMHGPVAEGLPAIRDAGPWRRVPFVILLAGLIIFGMFPQLLIRQIEPAAARLLAPASVTAPVPPPQAIVSPPPPLTQLRTEGGDL